MKIVQVIDKLNVGGAERVLVDQANLLYENGSDVSVICLLDKGDLDEQLNAAIPVTYIRRQNKYHPKYLSSLYSELMKYDVIHVHLRQVIRYVSLLFYFKGLHKKRVVVFQDHYGKIATNKELSFSIKKAIKNCSAYVGVSEQLTDWAKSNTLNKTIYKLTNIVRPSVVNSEAKLHTTQINIVSVGNFRPQKNYEFLCQLVSQSPKDFHFTIYGKIVDADYFKTIKALINQLQIEERVTIITDCNAVIEELPKYHLGLHCAASETGPLVAIEYLSVPIPFVTYNTGEVAKEVSKNFPEFIQNDFDIKNWNATILQLIKNREAYITNLKPYYSENYSENAYVESCLSLYKKLVNQ
jgi:glycosyltransferase involved in cell wall biosynthesis